MIINRADHLGKVAAQVGSFFMKGLYLTVLPARITFESSTRNIREELSSLGWLVSNLIGGVEDVLDSLPVVNRVIILQESQLVRALRQAVSVQGTVHCLLDCPLLFSSLEYF